MLLWPFNKYPGTDYETFNWDWLLRIGKRMEQVINDLFSDTGALHQMVDKVLGEHPEWTTTVMDGAITEKKLATSFIDDIEYRNRIDAVDVDTASFLNGIIVDREDATRQYDYQNGLAYDGTYFYAGYGPNTGVTQLATFLKLTRAGDIVDSVQISAGHGGTIAYNEKDGNLYIGNGVDTVYVYDTNFGYIASRDLSAQISGESWRGVSYDPYSDHSYVITVNNIYEYNADFTEYITSYTTPYVKPTEKQNACINHGYLFMASNYPNIISIYELGDNGFEHVKTILTGQNIDNTMMGEIEGVVASYINGFFELYISGAAIVAKTYYNSIYDMTTTPNNMTIQGAQGNNYETVGYVDGTFTGISDGTQSRPWKSIIEAAAHTSPEHVALIYVVTAGSLDQRTANVNYLPANRTYDIRYLAGSATQNQYLRYGNSTVQMVVQSTFTSQTELSFDNCEVRITVSDAVDADQYLVVTNRHSHITVWGDIYWSYNLGGSTIVKGDCTRTTSSVPGAITSASNRMVCEIAEEGDFTPTSGDTESGSFHYIKYTNGTCEAWGKFIISTNSAGAQGAMYYSETKTIELPFTMALPAIWHIEAENYFFATNFAINDGKNVKWRFCGARSAAQTSFAMYIYVRGTYS